MNDLDFVKRVLPDTLQPNKYYLMNFSRSGLERIYKVLCNNDIISLEEMSSGALCRNVYNLWLEKYEFSASVRFSNVSTKKELTEVLDDTISKEFPASKILKVYSREDLERMYYIYSEHELTSIYSDYDLVHVVVTLWQNYRRHSL